MTRPANRKAFTLLEVVLALSLTVGLLGGVLGFYRHVLNVRTAVVRQAERVASVRLVMDRITGELRGAMVYPFLGFGMDGQVDVEGKTCRMKFISVSLPGPAAWAVRKTTEDPIPPEYDMQLVGYRLLTVEDEQGVGQIVGLERTCQKILGARTAEEGPDKEIVPALLSGHIKFLRFRYWQDNDWVDTWSEGGLPLAVEITLGAEPLPEDTEPEDYPPEYESHRRVIYLPAAKASLEGPIIRGLNRGGRR